MKEKKHKYVWKRLLKYLYNNPNMVYGFIKDIDEFERKIAEEIGLTQFDVFSPLHFLEKQEMIKIIEPTNKDKRYGEWSIELTQKGFDVALHNEKEKLSAIFNTVIIYLTSVIFLTSMFTLINELEIMGKIELFWSYIAVTVFFAILCYLYIFRPLSK
ncbi:hypothetical protein CMI42_03210 [Candidatus Pacearchaeota archaeon]|nr:hypothetical protein [Candidatus Pacearchaeota archaeon]|tara:strand:- start:90 stop:563 length:474 start_codon:yes stop_codon:yes gene_type:complete